MPNTEMKQLSAAIKGKTNEVAGALGKKVVPFVETSSSTSGSTTSTTQDSSNRPEQIVDLQGWDSVAAMNFKTSNMGLKKRIQKNLNSTKIEYVETSKDKNGKSVVAGKISATFDNIRLRLGGDGKKIQIDALINITEFMVAPETVPVKNCTIVLEMDAQLINRKSVKKDKTGSTSGQNGQNGQNHFIDIDLTPQKEVVALSDPHFTPKAAGYKVSRLHRSEFKTMFLEWLNKNSKSMELVLASIEAEPKYGDELKWLESTNHGYAVVVPQPESNETAAFGVMSVAGNASKLPFQVPSNILPDGCDASISISRPLFLKYFIMPALAGMFKKTDKGNSDISKAEVSKYFDLYNDNTSIKNSQDLVLTNTKLDNGDTVSLTIEKGQFNCSLEGSTFKIRMEKIEFSANFMQNAKLFFLAEYKIEYNSSKKTLELNIISKTVDFETELKSWVLDMEIFMDLTAIILIIASIGCGAIASRAVRSAEKAESELAWIESQGQNYGSQNLWRTTALARKAARQTLKAGVFRNVKWATGIGGVLIEIFARIDTILINFFEEDMSNTKTTNILARVSEGLQDSVKFPVDWKDLKLETVEVHDALQFGYTLKTKTTDSKAPSGKTG